LWREERKNSISSSIPESLRAEVAKILRFGLISRASFLACSRFGPKEAMGANLLRKRYADDSIFKRGEKAYLEKTQRSNYH
jgi:hypothetical protein